MTTLPHNGWEFAGFVVLLIFMAFQVVLQYRQGGKMSLLEHHMNAMREAQLKTTGEAEHAKGVIAGREQERAKPSPLEHQIGPGERLEQIRGQE
jgi:hypothetical protein